MLHFLICDDEKHCRDSLKSLICEYSVLRDIEIDLNECCSGEELLNYTAPFDLLILDYQMGEKDGIEAARQLRKSGSEAAIIILTSFMNIVFSAFEINTFRFLLKPVDKEKLFTAIDDYVRTTIKSDVVFVKSSGSTVIIKPNLVLYIEGNGKNSIIHTKESESPIHCSCTLFEIERRLPLEQFFRCHRSFCVNLRYIENYSSSDVTIGAISIPIGRGKAAALKEAHIEYVKKYGL